MLYNIKLYLFYFFNFLPLILSVNVLTKLNKTINFKKPPCNLPSDFWCDSPEIALSCLGSLVYCDHYKTNRNNQLFKIELLFETSCPDSQKYIINRMYPEILTNLKISPLVDFKAIPWGLAKRKNDQIVFCHHGPRECVGNRVLRCALLYFQNETSKRDSILNCFMSKMVHRPPDPNVSIQQCLEQIKISSSIITDILNCGKNNESINLQKLDEIDTQRVGPPKFVPFIGINGKGHIEMQAYQLFLAEKLRAWNRTLSLITSRDSLPSNCQLPPDFWCSSTSISNDCYTQQGCNDYKNKIWNKPIHLKIIYNSQESMSRNYILNYLQKYFLTINSIWERENTGKVIIELEPSKSLLSNVNEADCHNDGNCLRRVYEECIANNIIDVKDRTTKLVCLLHGTNVQNLTTQLVTQTWATCNDLNNREIVIKCVNNYEWKSAFNQRIESQNSLKPYPPQWLPWVVINGYSFNTVQSTNYILHRMICIWYRGVSHDRDFCGRCEYESTHC